MSSCVGTWERTARNFVDGVLRAWLEVPDRAWDSNVPAQPVCSYSFASFFSSLRTVFGSGRSKNVFARFANRMTPDLSMMNVPGRLLSSVWIRIWNETPYVELTVSDGSISTGKLTSSVDAPARFNKAFAAQDSCGSTARI